MKKQAKPTHPKNETDNSGSKETSASQTDDTQRVNEQWIRVFLDSTSDMAFLKDENFRHIIVNPALCKFYGKTESEVLGKTDFDLMDEKAAAVCRKTDEQTLHQNDLHISEEVVGGRFYETRKFPVKLEDDKNGVGGYIRDITDRKRAEEALRKSERKFRETVINLDEGYYSVTLDGVLLEHNQAFSRILGFDQAADLKGKQMPDFWQNPDERNIYLKELAAKGSINGRQTKAKTTTGEKITVIISAHLVKDEDSLPLRIEGVVLDITERKRFEDQLQASEAQLRAIVDSTPFPMAIVDVEDDNIEYWSRSALELFGHTAPTTTEWYQLAYPDPDYRREVIERWKPFLEKARLCGEPVNTGEYRVSCHDGSVRICELYATFLPDRLVVTFNDITERVQAEEALRIREKDLRESQRIAHVGSWSLNVATNQVVWSDELYKMYGFDPALPPPPYTEHMNLFTPESWERLSTALAHTKEAGIPYTLELETVRKDGSNGWMWVHGEVDVDSAGKTVGLWGVAQDITAHKQAEDALRESEERYRRITENMSDFVSELDAQGVFRYNSPSIRRILGYDPEELIGSSAFDLVHPEDRDLVIATYMDGVKTESDRDVEQRYRRKDGTYIWLRSSGHPLAGSDGKNIGMIVNSNDITERKQADSQREAALKEIRNINENLEQRIEERTAELRKTIGELKETNRAFVGRELKMIELKERIAELEKKT